MQALRREILPPSGVEYAASLKFLPRTVMQNRSSSVADSVVGNAAGNLIVAHSNLLRIYEVHEEYAPFQASTSRDKWSRQRKDTEAVEGEVEMDTQGEGFVNMGAVKSSRSVINANTTLKLYFIREHRLYGTVTGLEGIKILSSGEDGLDRLLVSFRDAKIALLEWSAALHDVVTVSIHTYERAPQMMTYYPAAAKGLLRVDPNSRCVALSLPQDAFAILPFYQSQAELDLMDVDQTLAREIPYSQSFILDLSEQVDPRMRHIIDYIFLPGFNNPTVAVLCQPQQTWTGRLKEYKDTCILFFFTVDLVTHKYPIITTVENLPHDCFSIVACGPSLGGVIVSSSNALIYVDQASRKTALPTNGWASRVTDLPLQALRPEESDRDLHLEGSKLIFIDDQTFFLILKDGAIYPVDLVMDGKIFSRLSMGPPLAQTTIPSVVQRINDGQAFFVGSTVGPSVILKAAKVEELVQPVDDEQNAPSAVVDPPHFEIDDEEDIYGDAISNPQNLPSHIPNGHVSAVETKTVTHLSICDSLPAYGPIADISFALTRNGERPVAELVAATGYGHLGGFTLFQKDLPTRIKRKLHAVGGARGVWSLPVRQTLGTKGSDRTHKLAQAQAETDSVIISTDAKPLPGLTRFGMRSTKNDVSITIRRTETTIGAAPFFQRTAILHVTSDLIRVLEPDGSERQCIKDLDGVVKRPKIRYCSISDPFILILREDDSLGLFVGDAERGRIRRKDMTPMGEKISRYSAGCFYLDQSGVFETSANPSNALVQDQNGQKVATSLEAAVDAQRGSQWLILCRPQGVIEIWTLPKLTIVFSSSIITLLPSVISDSFDPPALSIPEDPPRNQLDTDIDQIQVASMGDTLCQPYVMVLLRCGQFAVYQAVPADPEWPEEEVTRLNTLSLRFAKVASRSFEPRQTETMERSVLSDHRKVLRQLIPFCTSPTPDYSLSGVFLTGDQPCWIIATAKSGVQIHSCSHSIVNSFTSCSMWDSKGDFLLYTDEGPCLLEWMPDVYLGTAMPSRSVPLQRNFTNVTFDAATGLLVAASCLRSKFCLFDEDGNKVWEPDARNVDYPSADCSTLELYSSDFSTLLDGYEFASNEFVNTVDCVTLETLSTESGLKDFIAVATTINRGEDLAVKGTTYIFEIVEVVPDPERTPSRNFRLRLLCRDEAKGPVTALCGMDGYLVSSMGQKIFVRAFDADERLVGVAFLDVGVYVTSLRALKNLLLIGDAVKSVWFVAFQEDPFKLVVLAKDVVPLAVATVDYLFTADGQFSIVVIDEEGVARLLEYEPTDPESRNGQYLLCRTEFHCQTECRTTTLVAQRGKDEDSFIPQARLICGCADGSLHAITPVDDSVMKRFQLLQGQLTRSVQHVAGLNPKAYRVVKNDRVSRPLSKGILDGDVLAVFPDLPISQQNEITAQIATERSTVLRDWTSLSGPW